MLEYVQSIGSESLDSINAIYNTIGQCPLGIPLLFFVSCIVIYIGVKTVKRIIDMFT